MRVVLALDQGTTSARAIAFAARGEVIAFDHREFAQTLPQPRCVEHDPANIWRSQLKVAPGALRDGPLSAADVVAIGITNQRETTFLWDRATGQPVRNVIVWQDRRTAAMCGELCAGGMEELVRAQTGLLHPYFCTTKIAWRLENVVGLRARAGAGEIAFGTVCSWLTWNLTGGARHVIDFTNISRTMLFEIHRRCRSDKLLEALTYPRSLLPGVLPCTADFRTTAVTHLGGAICIAGVGGDQQGRSSARTALRQGSRRKRTAPARSRAQYRRSHRAQRAGPPLDGPVRARTRPRELCAWKKQFMELDLGADAIAVMRKIKDAIDPLGIMNPGKVFPDPGGIDAFRL